MRRLDPDQLAILYGNSILVGAHERALFLDHNRVYNEPVLARPDHPTSTGAYAFEQASQTAQCGAEPEGALDEVVSLWQSMDCSSLLHTVALKTPSNCRATPGNRLRRDPRIQRPVHPRNPVYDAMAEAGLLR